MIDRTINNPVCISSTSCENMKLVPTARELCEALSWNFLMAFMPLMPAKN